jgi:hypothetical protein
MLASYTRRKAALIASSAIAVGATLAFAAPALADDSTGSLPPRAGYCSVDGNMVDGVAVAAGTFLDLQLGQPDTDPAYTGATPAVYVQGVGLTCDAPFSSLATQTKVDSSGTSFDRDPGAIYTYFAAASSSSSDSSGSSS